MHYSFLIKKNIIICGCLEKEIMSSNSNRYCSFFHYHILMLNTNLRPVLYFKFFSFLVLSGHMDRGMKIKRPKVYHFRLPYINVLKIELDIELKELLVHDSLV